MHQLAHGEMTNQDDRHIPPYIGHLPPRELNPVFQDQPGELSHLHHLHHDSLSASASSSYNSHQPATFTASEFDYSIYAPPQTDYFNYSASSVSVPSSRIDHLYTNDEPFPKRRMSATIMPTPQTPPPPPLQHQQQQGQPQPKGIKMLQKPKAIRQNSFPLAKGRGSPKQLSPLVNLAQFVNSHLSLGPYRQSPPTYHHQNQQQQQQPPQQDIKDKKKKPGFFLKLDNIDNQNLKYPPESLFSFNPKFPVFNDIDDDTDQADLRILERDLGADLNQTTSINSTNLTPSMKPPGSNQQEYFELDLAVNFAPTFLSPPINTHNDAGSLHQSSIDNHSTHTFEQYLDFPAKSLFEQPNPNEYYDNNDLGSYFAPGYSGSGDDASHASNHDPIYYDPHASYDHEAVAPHDQLNVPHDYSVLLADDSEYDMPPPRPGYDRRDSTSSVNSKTSLGNKRNSKGAVCTVCEKYISRDMIRHMRIHNEVGRFQCVYPKFMCKHKTQNFNRPYDYKKHLLNIHFQFDDPKGKTSSTLGDKLPLYGSCIACGKKGFTAKDWLDHHILTAHDDDRCPLLEKRAGDK